MSLAALELLEELTRRQDRQPVAENEEVGIPGNQRRALAHGEREHVIVARVGRPNRRRPFGIWDELSQRAKHADEAIGVRPRDSLPDPRIRERSLDLREQRLANDDFEFTGKPLLDEPRRRACPRDQGRDEDVGVEDDAHPLGRAALMLSLHGEADCLVFGEIGSIPDPFEQIEAEIATKRLLDHVAVTAAAAGGLHAHGTQNPLVERNRRSRLGHNRIIASI